MRLHLLKRSEKAQLILAYDEDKNNYVIFNWNCNALKNNLGYFTIQDKSEALRRYEKRKRFILKVRNNELKKEVQYYEELHNGDFKRRF